MCVYTRRPELRGALPLPGDHLQVPGLLLRGARAADGPAAAGPATAPAVADPGVPGRGRGVRAATPRRPRPLRASPRAGGCTGDGPDGRVQGPARPEELGGTGLGLTLRGPGRGAGRVAGGLNPSPSRTPGCDDPALRRAAPVPR